MNISKLEAKQQVTEDANKAYNIIQARIEELEEPEEVQREAEAVVKQQELRVSIKADEQLKADAYHFYWKVELRL